MASPITKITQVKPTHEQEVEQSLTNLQDSLVEHQEALQSLLVLIQDLQNSGVLDILHSLLNAKEKVATIALEQILKPSVLATMKNAMTVIGMVSKVNPEQLQQISDALVTGLERGKERLISDRRVTMLDVATALRDPGVNRSVGFMLALLQGMGQKL